jgi:hypothetical protein
VTSTDVNGNDLMIDILFGLLQASSFVQFVDADTLVTKMAVCCAWTVKAVVNIVWLVIILVLCLHEGCSGFAVDVKGRAMKHRHLVPKLFTNSMRINRVHTHDAFIKFATVVEDSVGAQDVKVDGADRDMRRFNFVKCIKCGSLYKFDELVDQSGTVVKCGVCDSQWRVFLGTVSKGDGNYCTLSPLSDTAVQAVRKQVLEMKKPNVKMHAKKQYVYVGNLPNSYEETDVQDLFAEYGVVNVNMVKDAQTLEFRGFAFVEVC